MAADRLRARHLAGVEFEVLPHAVENLPRVVDGEKVEVDAVGLRLAGIECEHAVVEAARERHRYFGHGSPSPRSISRLSFRGAPKARTRNPYLQAWGYGFRARRSAAPRNDSGEIGV